MSTEYRRGIPSTAHVEAATRLGLLWEDDDVGSMKARWRIEAHADGIRGDYATNNTLYTNWDPGSLIRAPDSHLAYRPIHPDGTPVDWEVLDQEVARGQQGQQGQPATVTPTASATPTTQPQGFRADLWRRICDAFFPHAADAGLTANDFNRVTGLDATHLHMRSSGAWSWANAASSNGRTDILARWTVYQELKPLYDIVDGTQGEAAMPRDVVTEWARQAGGSENIRPDWALVRAPEGLLGRTTNQQGGIISWLDSENWLGRPLRNFAAVLDAVAERRVAERVRGQTPTVTSGLPPVPIGTVMVQDVDGTVRPARMNDTARVIGLAGIDMPAAVRPAAQPEPRRFADVRPDRHGWRWWRLFGSDCGALGTLIEVSPVHGWRVKDDPDADWHLRGHYNSAVDGIRTVIPTDEQGNPVSWEAAGFTAEAMRSAQETVQRAASDVTPARSVGDIEWTAAGLPVTRDMTVDPVTGVVRSTHAARIESPTEAITTLPLPLPRFTADELDDVDHSKTTKLDEVTLRRGKLPTVEQIAKYREVRARRTGGTVADALKESRIDCEVAQYVLERWAGGLGDANVLAVIEEVRFLDCAVDVDKRAAWFIGLMCNQLDTSEKPSPTVQRERQEAEERRQRLAELRQRLATERAAQPTEEAPTTTSRFALIEPDPQADPAASIRAWEARQAAAKARPAAAPPHIAKPATTPRRPAIEVVDAEVDGLSRGDIVAALFGRALNGGC